MTGQEATTKITEVVASTDPVSNTCQTDPIVQILVYDERDNEAYTIARLCDGNYWMLDNLRLDLSDSAILNGLSVSNTHATEQALSCLKTGYYNGDPCASPYTVSAVSGSFSVTSGYTRAQVKTNYKDDVASATYGVGLGKVGVYYNYCAASAGSYCYGMNDGVSIDSLESDICPVGWHLPTGQANLSTEYRNLWSAYGNHTAFLNAFSVALSGYYFSSQTGLNVSGRLWTSTYFNNGQGTSMRRLYITASTTSYDAAPASDGVSTSDRFVGNSVRCVMDH
ncbi:hypothetical protein IJG89_02450 [Candidatus Saccharibacteria bacterium]|nr:hypothetical protein [Candidatus Saccharibacteria bacterium]